MEPSEGHEKKPTIVPNAMQKFWMFYEEGRMKDPSWIQRLTLVNVVFSCVLYCCDLTSGKIFLYAT